MPHAVFALLLALIAPIAPISSPALANAPSIQIPEPGDATLFVLAVAGLLIGRHASRNRSRRRDDE